MNEHQHSYSESARFEVRFAVSRTLKRIYSFYLQSDAVAFAKLWKEKVWDTATNTVVYGK